MPPVIIKYTKYIIKNSSNVSLDIISANQNLLSLVLTLNLSLLLWSTLTFNSFKNDSSEFNILISLEPLTNSPINPVVFSFNFLKFLSSLFNSLTLK